MCMYVYLPPYHPPFFFFLLLLSLLLPSLQILREVDTILFCLLVLRGLIDSQGRVWRNRPTQLYAIEVTLPKQLEQQVRWIAVQCVCVCVCLCVCVCVCMCVFVCVHVNLKEMYVRIHTTHW